MLQAIASILIWGYFTVLSCLFFVLILVTRVLTFPFDPYSRWPNAVLQGLAYAFIYGVPGWHMEVRGQEHLDPDTPAICVSNHQSFFDLPLYYLIPGTMKWVAKKSLFYIPILGWIIYLVGHIALDRSSKLAFSRLTSAVPSLEEGISIMIFPEGTRTLDGSVGPFKNGAFRLAMDQQVPIQPMVLHGGYEAMPTGSWQFGLHQNFVIQILPRVYPDDYESISELRNEVRAQIISTLTEIREEQHRVEANAHTH
jgi:1-acyl-sn-glycerol-3-phosphate acyltransferase